MIIEKVVGDGKRKWFGKRGTESGAALKASDCMKFDLHINRPKLRTYIPQPLHYLKPPRSTRKVQDAAACVTSLSELYLRFPSVAIQRLGFFLHLSLPTFPSLILDDGH
jgi:hypothetical protein